MVSLCTLFVYCVVLRVDVVTVVVGVVSNFTHKITHLHTHTQTHFCIDTILWHILYIHKSSGQLTVKCEHFHFLSFVILVAVVVIRPTPLMRLSGDISLTN